MYSILLYSYRSLSSGSIRPRCMDGDPGFRRCDSGQLTFNEELTLNLENGRSVNITRYNQVYGQYTALRPIYKAVTPGHSTVSVYLYHADGSWRLGQDYIRSTSAFARVSDMALRAEFITGVWQIYYNGVWHRDLSRKLHCTTSTSTLTLTQTCHNCNKTA